MPASRRRIARCVAVAVLLAAFGAASATSSSAATVAPAFVQKISGHQSTKATLALAPAANLGTANRLIVEVGIWSSANATASGITDSSGNTYTELLHVTAADHTELSVWSAPVTAGVGTKPTITVKATGVADIGAVALEYSGLSTATGTGSVDVTAQSTGKTTAAATVSSGATAPVSSTNELALGFYNDSGFNSALAAGAGFTARANVSPASDMQSLVEDQPATMGATATATAHTGASTYWQMATVVFLAAQAGGAPTVPAAPVNPVATAGDGTASVTWTAPSNGGAPITSYSVTPHQGSTTLSAINVTGNPVPTSVSISGLSNDTAYTFAVTATNSVGTGPGATSNAVTPAAMGTWAPLQTWPIMPLATHLLYTGKTISWDGWQQPQPSVVWDPSNPSVYTTINPPDSIFCDGAADLPDGRLLVIGGYGGLSTGQIGIVDTNIFDPTTNTWSRVANMHVPRWYPTVTELSDGRYLALSGNSTNNMTWADTPEVYDPTSNTWTLLSGVNTSTVHEVEYPFTYEVPNGDVFVIGPEEDNSHLLDVNAQSWTSTGASGLKNGSSVMYLPGKILYSGGAALIDTPSASTNATAVIDLNAATPAWRSTAPMNNKRIYHTLTMLADGTVLAVGGSNTSDQQVITTGVMPTEIWNPTTETWTPSAPIAAARNYHSTSILMPDGTVMVSGGGHPEGMQDAGQYSSQIYTPDYLLRGARPTITSAPVAATYGASMPVATPDAASITAVNLVSLGADTHQMDMNQHFVPLTYTVDGGNLNVAAPNSATIAPPGYYMLFILKDGVPSVAKMVHIGAATAQTVPATVTGVTATAGDSIATVQWQAPASGGTPITSYQVTPYQDGTALAPVTITGNPVPTSATITGLTNGAAYTFTVAATNAVGTGNASAASNAVTPGVSTIPAFVQKVSAITAAGGSLAVTPAANVTVGDRIVVQVGVWSSSHATTSAVTDSAGNVYTKLTSFVGTDSTEMSVWSAPVSSGGVQPVITATTTSAGEIGVTAMEYSGLSTAPGTAAVDVSSHTAGTTTTAATVNSGPTTPTTGANELAVGFYADSGFNFTLTPGIGWTSRANVSPNGDMQLLGEDSIDGSGVTSNASFGTGAGTPWLAATLVFKNGVATPPTVPSAPTGVTATSGNGTATVSWSAPANGGSPITGYTVTPYIGSVAQATTSAGAGATSAAIGSLTNGTSYTFRVTATNSVGDSLPSSASNSVIPTAAPAPKFVQQVSAKTPGATKLAVTPASVVTAGNRLIVQVGVWSSAHATTSAVADSAGNVYTELLHFAASDGTEMSVWSAPITAGGGTKPVITATATGSADIGVGVSEYSGLAAASPVDVSAHATGTATTARSVSSGATAATTGSGMSIGFYADSGFNTTPTADPGYSARVTLAHNANMDLLSEDAAVIAGATPAPTVGTQAGTVWLMATIVFKGA